MSDWKKKVYKGDISKILKMAAKKKEDSQGGKKKPQWAPHWK